MTVRPVLVGAIIGLGLVGACDSRPDTDPRPELEALYDFLYEEAASQFGRDLRTGSSDADRLARSRLVAAANSLVDEAAANRRPRYEIELRHLNIPEETPDQDTPFHFRVTVTAEELAELGVAVRPWRGPFRPGAVALMGDPLRRPVRPGKRPGPRLRRTSVLFCAPLLLVLAGCSAGPGSSHVQGEVLDHRSGKPIAGATLVLERRGWGRSDAGGQIVWDKRYRTQAVTDDYGTFSLELPGPRLLVGRGPGVLSVEADGFHALRTRVEGGARVSLHTIVDHEEGSPGGTARLGRLPEGRTFGWSFVESRAVTEPERADLLVQDISASETRVTLTVPPGGGLLFIPLSEQEIGTPAEGHLLRFLDEPPRTPEADRLTLDSNPGTLFLRTRDRRYAKLGWDPEVAFSVGDRVPELEVTAADQVLLPFVYRPLSGRFLPFQPPVPPLDPLFAAAGAELNDADDTGAEGPLDSQGSRRLVLELRGSDASVLDSRVVTLEPGRPERIQVTPRGLDSTWHYENLLLDYDDHGLPRVGLRIAGPRSSHNFMPKWVTRRLETEFHFDAYLETGSTPVGLTLAVREER